MPQKKAATRGSKHVSGANELPEDVELETKTEPSQDRAKTTFEKILTITGELLLEVGFERLSTNLICKRAGITPPALYRYFPNKYAILRELGERLMKAQDDIVMEWIDEGGINTSTFDEAVASNRRMLERVNEVTKQFPGGAWVLRVMRVIPLLREVRQASRDLVSRKLFDAMKENYPNIPDDRLYTATLLSTETMYAATEVAIEEPDQEKAVTEEVCYLVSSYYERLRTES